MQLPSSTESLKSPFSVRKSTTLDSLLSLSVKATKSERKDVSQNRTPTREHKTPSPRKNLLFAFQDERGTSEMLDKRKERDLVAPSSALKVGKYRTVIDHKAGLNAKFRSKRLEKSTDLDLLVNLGHSSLESERLQNNRDSQSAKVNNNMPLRSHVINISSQKDKKSNVIMDIWNKYRDKEFSLHRNNNRQVQGSLENGCFVEKQQTSNNHDNKTIENNIMSEENRVNLSEKSLKKEFIQYKLSKDSEICPIHTNDSFLKNLHKGSLVFVKELSSPYKPGGIGRITNVSSDDMYCIRYVLGGWEKHVNKERIEKVPNEKSGSDKFETISSRTYNLRQRNDHNTTDSMQKTTLIKEKNLEDELKKNTENSPELLSKTASLLAAMNSTNKQLIHFFQPEHAENHFSSKSKLQESKDILQNPIIETDIGGFSLAKLDETFSLLKHEMESSFKSHLETVEFGTKDFVTLQHIHCRRSKLDFLTLQRKDVFQRMEQLYSQIHVSLKKMHGDKIQTENKIGIKKSSKLNVNEGTKNAVAAKYSKVTETLENSRRPLLPLDEAGPKEEMNECHAMKRRSKSASGRKQLKPFQKMPKQSKDGDSDDGTYVDEYDFDAPNKHPKKKKSEHIDDSEDSSIEEYHISSRTQNTIRNRSTSREKKRKKSIVNVEEETLSPNRKKKRKKNKIRLSNSKPWRMSTSYSNTDYKSSMESLSDYESSFESRTGERDFRSRSYTSTSSFEDEILHLRNLKSKYKRLNAHGQNEAYSYYSDEIRDNSTHSFINEEKESKKDRHKKRSQQYYVGRRLANSNAPTKSHVQNDLNMDHEHLMQKRSRRLKKLSTSRERYNYIRINEEQHQAVSNVHKPRRSKPNRTRAKSLEAMQKVEWKRTLHGSKQMPRHLERKYFKTASIFNYGRFQSGIPSISSSRHQPSTLRRRSVSPSNAHSILEDI